MHILLLAIACLPLWAADHQLRSFSNIEIEIENKRNEKGQKLPDDAIPDLKEQLAGALVALHFFHRVDDFTDSKVPKPQTIRIVLLRLRITGYSGARNNAGIKSLVTLIDKESGQERISETVNAQLRYDSGALAAAARKLARSTADLVKNSW